MIFFKTYFGKVIKYDLVNTFIYQNLRQIPELKKIVLNFGYQKSNLKYLISGLLALEFISSKKGKAKVSSQVMDTLNSMIADGHVQGIYFTEFVIQ